MKRILSLLLPAAVLISMLFACKKDGSFLGFKKDAVKVEMHTFVKHNCVNDQQCAEFNILYPRFSGADSLTLSHLNKSVDTTIIHMIGGVPTIPLEVAMDTIADMFLDAFLNAKRDNPTMTNIWMIQQITQVPFQSSKVLTIDYNASLYGGGTSGVTNAKIRSFDMQKQAAILNLKSVVKDSAAFRPLLENGFRKAKGIPANVEWSSVLLPGYNNLPFPNTFGIVKEGVRIVYGSYEVTNYYPTPTDYIISWKELGALADKSKWLDE